MWLLKLHIAISILCWLGISMEELEEKLEGRDRH